MKTNRSVGIAVILIASTLWGIRAQSQQESAKDLDYQNLIEKIKQQLPSQPEVIEDPILPDITKETTDSEKNTSDNIVELTISGSEDSNRISTIRSGTENLVTIRFQGTLEKAISMFADLSGANIIVPELEEDAQVSVSLTDVEWQSALQSILATYNYELYQRIPGTEVYSVRIRPEGDPEPQIIETFVLKYATVPNVAKLISQILPPDAKISEFASRNMLVVKSTKSSLLEVRSVLESIDTVREQVYIEAKFMELTSEAQKDLGIDWEVLRGFSVGTSGATTLESTDKKTDSSTTTYFYDSEGNQYEAASSYSEALRGDSSASPWIHGGLTPTYETIAKSEATEILTSVLSADQFQVILSALEENTGANIVSNPKIIVANEEPANISILRKEPNLKQDRQESQNDTADNITYSLDDEMPFFEYGIKLDVTPSINTSSNITVAICPSLTRKYGEKEAGDNTYPIIDEKSITTVFNLASGQTAAIGGLTQITESEVVRKVPLLGSIPFIGRLFRWEETVNNQTETIIFVTVGLANTQQMKVETGLPSDAELARRQVIQEKNKLQFREQDREYFNAKEADKLDDLLELLEQNEKNRIEAREQAILEAAEKKAVREAKEAAKKTSTPSN